MKQIDRDTKRARVIAKAWLKVLDELAGDDGVLRTMPYSLCVEEEAVEDKLFAAEKLIIASREILGVAIWKLNDVIEEGKR
jgi:hypothetical protein